MDELNLNILRCICSGVGVRANISALARKLDKHRNTITKYTRQLFSHSIINEPIYPFMYLYEEFPLLVAAQADLPRTDAIAEFFHSDPHTFAAFYVRDGEYNTLMIEYHRDIYHYGEWKKQIVAEKKIPPRMERYPAHAMFFSNRHMLKYQPQSPITVLERWVESKKPLVMRGYELSELSFAILKHLVMGRCIRTNENRVAREVGVHRKTVERRIERLLAAGVVTRPVCRFPKFFVPPGHLLVYTLIEVRRSRPNVLAALKRDSNIPIALEANIGRYNLLLFKVFPAAEDQFLWEERYDQRFPGTFGAMKKLILSPQMTAAIDQQKVSLGIIDHYQHLLHGEQLMETVQLGE